MRISHFRARAARLLRWHRREVSAACVGACVLLCLVTLSPSPPATVPVLVAAHELAPGSSITAADLRIARYPDGLAPSGALATGDGVVGRVVGARVTEGTPVTGATTVSAAPSGHDGELLVGFHLADASLLSLLQVGDRVTVVSGGQDGQVVTLASRVRVAALPRDAASTSLAADTPASGMVVVAADPETAKRIAAFSTGQSLSVALG